MLLATDSLATLVTSSVKESTDNFINIELVFDITRIKCLSEYKILYIRNLILSFFF